MRQSFYLNSNSNATKKEWIEQLSKVRNITERSKEEAKELLKKFKRYTSRYKHTNTGNFIFIHSC
jgi:histidinol-phosphate/aromatic aminotransferase/cobyric acid decarboxylase-like protein